MKIQATGYEVEQLQLMELLRMLHKSRIIQILSLSRLFKNKNSNEYQMYMEIALINTDFFDIVQKKMQDEDEDEK